MPAEGSTICLWVVDSALGKWVTAENPPGALGHALRYPVLDDGLAAIFRTRRVKRAETVRVETAQRPVVRR